MPNQNQKYPPKYRDDLIHPAEYHLENYDIPDILRYNNQDLSWGNRPLGEYFNIYFPPNNYPGVPILSYGKHYFILSFSPTAPSENLPRLKAGSRILFEFQDGLDGLNNRRIIFSDLTPYRGLSNMFIGYVWLKEDPLRTYDSLVAGNGKLYIVGQVETQDLQWKNKFNIRTEIDFPIELQGINNNTSPILLQNTSQSIAEGFFVSESMGSTQGNAIPHSSFAVVSASRLQTYGGQLDSIRVEYLLSSSVQFDGNSEYKPLQVHSLGTGDKFNYEDDINSDYSNGINPMSEIWKIPIPTLDIPKGPDKDGKYESVKFKFIFENTERATTQNLFSSGSEDIEIIYPPEASNWIAWTGSSTVLSGEGNLIRGQTHLGRIGGTGMEFSGMNSAFIRSVGYRGFTSASLPDAEAKSGFMIFSGSVIPDETDDYSLGGVGLELVRNSASFFRFRTSSSGHPNGLLEIKTDTFFLGSGNQFVSGSNGNIEISASGLHLQTGEGFGQITASEALIGGWTVDSDQLKAGDLTGTQFFEMRSIGRIQSFQANNIGSDPLILLSIGQTTNDSTATGEFGFSVDNFGNNHWGDNELIDTALIRIDTEECKVAAHRMTASVARIKNLTVSETASISYLHSNIISSSIVQASGSTIFGDSSTDTHQFVGEVSTSGDFKTGRNIYFTNTNLPQTIFVSSESYNAVGPASSSNYFTMAGYSPFRRQLTIGSSTEGSGVDTILMNVSGSTVGSFRHIPMGDNGSYGGNPHGVLSINTTNLPHNGAIGTVVLYTEGGISSSGNLHLESDNEINLKTATSNEVNIGFNSTQGYIQYRSNPAGSGYQDVNRHYFVGNVKFNQSASIGNANPSPNHALTVAGNISASGDLKLEGSLLSNPNPASTTNWGLTFSDTSMSFGSSSGVAGISALPSLVLFSSKNVSMGTNFDSGEKLTVKGNISSSGKLVIGGATSQSKTLTVKGDISSSGHIFLNPGGIGQGFISLGNSGMSSDMPIDDYITYNTSEDRIIIKSRNVEAQTTGDGFLVQGNISASGYMKISSHITASGDISASLTSTGSFGQGHFLSKVGIGTTSPFAELNIVGPGSSDAQVYINDRDNGVGSADGLLIQKSGVNTYIYNRDSGHLEIGSNNKQQLHIEDGGVEGQLKIRSGVVEVTGNISASGTGSFGTGDKMFIHADASNSDIVANNNHFRLRTNRVQDEILFQPNNTNVMMVSASGRVGIGTLDPGSELHVIGTISASGGITSSGGFHQLDQTDNFFNGDIQLATGRYFQLNGDTLDDMLFYSAGVVVQSSERIVLGGGGGTHVVGALTASSNISSSGNYIGNQYHITYHNMAGVGTSQVYIPFPTSTTEGTTTSYLREWIAPFDGTLEKIRLRGTTAGGNTICRLFVNKVMLTGADSTSDTVSVSADTSTTFTFSSNNSYSAGDLIRVTIDATDALGNVNMCCIWNYNTNSL